MSPPIQTPPRHSPCNSPRFNGKTALVTDGTVGLGAIIAQTLQQEGYRVLVNYRGPCQEAHIFHAMTNIPIYSWNSASWEDCQNNIEFLQSTYGPIHILVHSIETQDKATIASMSPHQWHEVMDAHLNSLFYLTKAMIPSLVSSHYGRIISIGAMESHTGAPAMGHYNAARCGAEGLIRTLAQEMAYCGVTANVIAPGAIQTEPLESMAPEVLEYMMTRIPLKRFGIGQEVAALVGFLLSSAGGFITGTTLHINGGQWMG